MVWALGAGAAGAQDDVQYQVVDLGLPDPSGVVREGGVVRVSVDSTDAVALNDDGVVVGSYGLEIEMVDGGTTHYYSPQRGYHWQDGVFEDLGQFLDLPTTLSLTSRDVNTAGDVAVDTFFGLVRVGPYEYRPYHAMRWSAGHLTDLGSRPEARFDSAPAAINDRGEMAGRAQNLAVLWSAGGGTVQLGTLDPLHVSWAYGLNDQGTVVGESVHYLTGLPQAFVWTPADGMRALDPNPGPYRETTATAINDAGVIVGALREQTSWRPVRWVGGQMEELRMLLSGDGAIPMAVNERGQIVGSFRGGSRPHAFVWTDATFTAPYWFLENRIPAGSGWELWQANDINEEGWIVGWGRHNGEVRAFLLVPDDSASADLDVDTDGDGTIDDADDPRERFLGVVAAPNLDDDDGDGVRDGEDELVNGPADRAEMTRLVARRPPGVAPSAQAVAVLRVHGGDGKVRVFLEDPAGDRLLLGPDDVESPDLWPQLDASDLALLAEGVDGSYVLLELEVTSGSETFSDVVKLEVPGFELDLDAAEPFLDRDDGAFAGGVLDVPADHVALDLDGTERPRAVNLVAGYLRADEAHPSSSRPEPGPLPERAVRWEVSAVGAGQSAVHPVLRDLSRPGEPGAATLDHATVLDGFSRIALDFGFDHPRSGDPWAHAGDLFRIRVTAADRGGAELSEERLVRIVPGDKLFHVCDPPDDLDPEQAWRLTDAEFAQAYGGRRLDLPVGSGDREELEWVLFDAYRNPIAAGGEVELLLEGGGHLGGFDPTADGPDPAGTPTARVLAGGRLRSEFVQDVYANCPWSPTPQDLGDSLVVMDVDGVQDPANESLVDRSEPLPAPPGPIVVEPLLRSVTPTFYTPDADRGDTRDLPVFVYRQAPDGRHAVVGATVRFASQNGRLADDGVVRTDASGIAVAQLTAEEARPDEEILVTAAVGTERSTASLPGMRWTSSAPTVVEIEHPVVVGDRTTAGTSTVETLQDRGESAAFPGAVEGDFSLSFPYYVESDVDVSGLPGHDYLVTVIDGRAWRVSAHYPFDELVAGDHTPEVERGLDAVVSGATLDAVERVAGDGSLAFVAGNTVRLPADAAFDAGNGLRIELWVRPDAHPRGRLIDRPGELTLEIVEGGPDDGHVRVSVEGAGPGGGANRQVVTSAAPLPAEAWSFLEVHLDPGALRLGAGPDPRHLEVRFAIFPTFGAASSSAEVTVGEGFAGHLDELRFTTGGHAAALLALLDTGPGGVLTTDANGRATFRVASADTWRPDEYRPVEMRIELAGSRKVEAQAHVVPEVMWADLVGVGKAFLMGEDSLGEDARWFERASAWVSGNVPLLSDLRSLTMEAYKAATGCDRVSLLNVAFSTVGLLSDVATFGTAGRAVDLAEAAFRTSKLFLREFATNNAFGALAQAAVAAYARGMATATTGKGESEAAPAWVVGSEAFQRDVVQWSQGDPATSRAQVFDAAFHNVQDVHTWAALHDELGQPAMDDLLTDLRDMGSELEQ